MRASQSRYKKISDVQGFRTLVDTARTKLGLTTTSIEEALRADVFGDLARAAWTIMDLCDLQSEDQLFAMNAIALGVDGALKTKLKSAVSILVPEVPREQAYELANELAEKLWPEPGQGQ